MGRQRAPGGVVRSHEEVERARKLIQYEAPKRDKLYIVRKKSPAKESWNSKRGETRAMLEKLKGRTLNGLSGKPAKDQPLGRHRTSSEEYSSQYTDDESLLSEDRRPMARHDDPMNSKDSVSVQLWKVKDTKQSGLTAGEGVEHGRGQIDNKSAENVQDRPIHDPEAEFDQANTDNPEAVERGAMEHAGMMVDDLLAEFTTFFEPHYRIKSWMFT